MPRALGVLLLMACAAACAEIPMEEQALLDEVAVALSDIDDLSWSVVSLGELHACGIRSGGALWCAGQDGMGQLGDGDLLMAGRYGTRIGNRDWVDVSVGYGHTCAVETTGGLWCWGSNDPERGELGIETEGNQTNPVLVDSGPYRAVAAGWAYSCAIRADDVSLWCWGRLSTTFGSNEPVLTEPTQIGAGAWRSIETQSQHVCGIQLDASLWCWGLGAYGQLGNAENPESGSATPIEVGGRWSEVATGEMHTCAIKTEGTLWCWGADTDGITDYRGVWYSEETGFGAPPTPQQIGSDDDWSHVTAGAGFVCGIRQTNRPTLWCWGRNDEGQLHLGDTEARTVPTRVGTERMWVMVEATHDHFVAIALN